MQQSENIIKIQESEEKDNHTHKKERLVEGVSLVEYLLPINDWPV